MEYNIAKFNGKRFLNQEPHTNTFNDFIKWRLNKNPAKWPKWLDNNLKPNIKDVVTSGIKVTYINHVSFLIQLEGINIITDPIFSDRASPLSFAGPKRIHAPGISFDELPKIDVILISHTHYDHLDIPSVKQIVNRDNSLIVTGLKVGSYITNKTGYSNIIELNWWETHKFSSLNLHFVPVHHWSSRSLFDQNETLWGGFVIESTSKKIYFPGDTGWGVHFEQTAKKFGEFDICLMPIGSYEPRWFMKNFHINPEEAVEAHKILKSKLSIGMHFDCFQLSEEPVGKAAEDLKYAINKHAINPNKFIVPKPGQEFEVE